MVDENLKPWLVEVNHSPSFSADSCLDYRIKKRLIQDTFILINPAKKVKKRYIYLFRFIGLKK